MYDSTAQPQSEGSDDGETDAQLLNDYKTEGFTVKTQRCMLVTAH